MNKHVRVLCILALSLLSAGFQSAKADVGSANVEKIEKIDNPPASVNLEYKFKVGEMRRYNMTIDGMGVFALPKNSDETKLETHTKLVAIQHATAYLPKEQIWKLEIDVLSAIMTIPGFGETLLTFPPLDVEVDKYGQVRQIKGLEDFAATHGQTKDKTIGNIVSQLKFLGLPRKELRVGDTWEQEYSIEALDQSLTVKATSKLVGFERVEGKDCAKIETKYDVPFKFEMKKNEKASEADDTSKDATKRFLVGTEKVERVTHFAYDEGKIIRTQATIVLAADIQMENCMSDGNTSSTSSESNSASKQHDLDVKYTLVSKFSPELPINLEEKE
ncbi:MAG: hypothetical protein QME62_01250 [Armatimonadota bacterium]|nr:hypothetical protein [Armatimonadota bacterium]